MGAVTDLEAFPIVQFESSPSYPEPLDDDEVDDLTLVVSRRELCRLALIASEVGALFQAQEVPHEPMAWLLAPRELFQGAAPLDACLQRDNLVKALLLHRLHLGLDADPADLDGLVGGDPYDHEVVGGLDDVAFEAVIPSQM